MSYDRAITPLRPDSGALARSALRSVARAALHACRTAGKPAERIPHAWRDDQAIEGLITRAPVTPTTLAATTALQQVRVNFLPSLVPVSAAAAVLDASMKFSFDGASSISCPAVTLPLAGWLAENSAISVLQGTTSAVTLSPYKLAAIVTMTHEMISGGDAEAVMTQVLMENIGASLDAVFLTNAAASAGVSPPGILNGAISVTAAAAGSGAMVTDLSALAAAVAAVSGGSRMVLVAAPKQAEAIRLIAVDPPVVYASNQLADKTVVAIVPGAIASANSTPLISVSRETTIHMASPAADLVISPSTVSAPQKSMFQADSLALRFLLDLTWVKRGAGVAVISSCNWP